MGNYDKYICTTLEKIHLQPGPTPAEKIMLAKEGWRLRMENILWLDAEVLPGGYYGEAAWIWPETYARQITQDILNTRTTPNAPMFPHYHEYPELLSWWGTDPDNFDDTTEMKMIMGDEEIHLKGSWVCYAPAKMYHMPMGVKGGNVTSRPMYHWTSGPGMYTRDKDEDSSADGSVGEVPVPGSPRKSTTENRMFFVMGGDQKVCPVKIDYMPEIDPKYCRHVAYVDENIIPGAEFGCNTKYLLPGFPKESGMVIMEPHTLPYGTTITMSAMNYDDLYNLDAEVELWIGGEKHLINKRFGAYVPPGVEQGPLIVRNMKKQIFFLTSGPVGEGIKKYPGGS